jgi:hypothetical protein
VKKIDLSEASKPLAEYAAELGDDMVVVTVNEKPIAAVISLKNVENADEESLGLSASRAFLEIVERSRAEFEMGRTLTLDEMKRAVLP